MNNRMKQRMTALILALLMLTLLAACTKENPEQTPAPAAAATEQEQEPEEEEIVLSGEPSSAAPTGDPATEQKPEPEKEGVVLSDGAYAVRLYREQTVDANGTVWVSFALMHFVELPDYEVAVLKAGDTVALPEYSFVIESMQQDDDMGVRWILFNDGTERCFYIEDTNIWRFTWPNDEPYLWEGEHNTMPLAADIVLTDELTPLSEGRNVYGVSYDENDASIGALDLLEDFFNHYPGMDAEYATVTVRNGEIAEILIEYHP